MEPTLLDIQRQGDLGGTKVAMKFDENSLAHIMSVLTDLYSDPALAIIREYSTNAWDAHVAAGNMQPIEVTTPSQMSPYFKVKDYGIGLSVDDISEIYSKYGASTKRDTNEQVGMLGLGCKSALTYTQQFSLVAVKNGVKATVSISRIEDGTGVMEIVDTRGTDEPNGVEVIIPVRQSYDFDQKVANFFRFWEPGSVLVNGAEPERIEGMKVTDDIMVITGTTQDYVVMGNVGYPVKDGLISNREYGARYGVVSRVGIGQVNFTPSREALHYTTTTNNTLARLKTDFSASLTKAIQDNIDESDTHATALNRYREWIAMLGSKAVDGVTYKGEAIPLSFYKDEDSTIWQYRVHFTRNNTTKIGRVDAKVLETSLVITGFDKNDLSSAQRKKVKNWAAENNIGLDTVLFMDGLIGSPWVQPKRVVKWEDVKTTKSKRTYDAQGFNVMMKGDGYFRTIHEMEADAEIIYFSPSEITDFNAWGVVRTLGSDAIIVKHGLNRHKTLVRDFENAEHYKTFFIRSIREFMDSLTEQERFFLAVDSYVKSMLNALDENRIDDPEVVKMIKALRDEDSIDREKINRYYEIQRMISRLYLGISMEIDKVKDNPLLRYPLVNGSVIRENVEDVYVYMNAKYNASLKEIENA